MSKNKKDDLKGLFGKKELSEVYSEVSEKDNLLNKYHYQETEERNLTAGQAIEEIRKILTNEERESLKKWMKENKLI